jgi:hypothetical protein
LRVKPLSKTVWLRRSVKFSILAFNARPLRTVTMHELPMHGLHCDSGGFVVLFILLAAFSLEGLFTGREETRVPKRASI